MTASKVADGTELDRDMGGKQIGPRWLAADYHRSARTAPSDGAAPRYPECAAGPATAYLRTQLPAGFW